MMPSWTRCRRSGRSLQNFRAQVAETYLKDETSLDRLVKEVFERGQKDLALEHILFASRRIRRRTIR
jgi:hypothetical protein